MNIEQLLSELLNEVKQLRTDVADLQDDVNRLKTDMRIQNDTLSKNLNKALTERNTTLLTNIKQAEINILDNVNKVVYKGQATTKQSTYTPAAKRDDIDEESLKADYLSNQFTLASLANKYNMSVAGIRNRLIACKVYNLKYNTKNNR